MLACVWRGGGQGEAMVMAPPPTHDSAVSPCLHGCLAFLHRHFPPQSPPSQPLNPSLRSQLQPSPGDCSTIPKLQLPAAAVWGMYGCGKDVWISFCLGCHRLALSLSSLNVLWLRQLPPCGDRNAASVPPPAEGRSSRTNSPVLPPSSFLLQSFAWVYVFFSTGQVLLSALSWCSACTSVSEGVFLIYPRREIYSMSTYSAILFSPLFSFAKFLCRYWPIF